MLVNGYTLGTKLQITSYLTSRYAGMRNFGAIFGFMVSVTSLGGALGPLLAGMSYDNLGGYEAFLIAGTIGCVISGLLIFSLPPVPNWEGQGEKVREDPSCSSARWRRRRDRSLTSAACSPCSPWGENSQLSAAVSYGAVLLLSGQSGHSSYAPVHNAV